jgi:flavin-dependent dehydrogenase
MYPAAPGDADATTTVQSTAGGWWYTSPVPGGRRVVAFLTDGDLLPGALRSPLGFDRAARRVAHVATLLAAGAPAPPIVVAAGTSYLEPVAGDGWLAAGDAAATFDPISSQGILTAVLMGREAARCAEQPAEFASRYRSIVARYDAERRATYALEQRWPTSAFWARRAG